MDKLVDDVLVVIDETTSKDTIKKSIESDSKELVDTGDKPNTDSVKDDCLEVCGDSRQVDQEERAQSEEAQFDSLPDLEDVESSAVDKQAHESIHDDLRQSEELDIPMGEADLQSGKNYEQEK